jgi:EAL domain-containing protein (putative c-di-GMP-specific phosphodiesterase class I)/FixJ family two-component response regulator
MMGANSDTRMGSATMVDAASKDAVTVLVVDDDPFICKWFVRQLNGLGYSQVSACVSARDAMNAMDAASGNIDIVFCDLQMPDIDGVEFVRYLVQSNYQGGLVLISGEDQRILQTAEKLAQGRKLNVLGALKKPATTAQLQAILGNRLSAAPHRRASAAPHDYVAADLQQAINGGQLVNYYQPKVELVTGKIIGVETLVRWQHPAHGLVMPDRFVPLAETAGLIGALTHAVLTGALRQARQWRNSGLDLRLAVNISMLSLTDIHFPDALASLAAEAGVAVSTVVLEVTESTLMKDPIASLDILTRLRLKGFGLSIDDFGTGHSSLAQLRDVPFNELKIDGGFVHGAWRNTSTKAIFDASLGLARQLHITAVAEGVEDRADWNFLRQANCDLAQGDFIGKPMPGNQLPEWISDWHERDLAA